LVCRVGVVDDHHGIRLVFRASLKADPRFEWVGEAANGFEAVMLVEDVQPDVIVLDLTMPVLDGLEALPLIRSASPGTKVILFSSYVEPSRVMGDLPGLPDAFIDKGQTIETVLDLVVEVAERDRPHAIPDPSAGTDGP
jgi:DNA-binding NarL/FixJ family response regulator